MIAGLDHITIATPKLEETRRFFVEVLGLNTRIPVRTSCRCATRTDHANRDACREETRTYLKIA